MFYLRLYLRITSMRCSQRPQERIRIPGTGVRNGASCHGWYGCWQPNLNPLREQPALLAAEPSPALAIITFDYGLLFPAKSSSSALREVSLFRSLYNILHFQSKRNSSGKRTLSRVFPCGSQKEIRLALENPM